MAKKQLDDIFEIKVGRGRTSKMRPDISSLGRLSSIEKAKSLGKTEVLLKIGGANISSQHHLQQAADYIARNGSLDVKNEQGATFSKDEYREEINRWVDEAPFVSDNAKSESIARRIIISMPEGTDTKKFEEATTKWAESVLKNHDYLMAFHNHESDERSHQPHVHILLRNVGKDGKRFHLNNAERNAVREHLAKCFRDVGIEVNATSRDVRGKTVRSLKDGEYRAVRRFKDDKDRARAHAISRKKKKTGNPDLPKTFKQRVKDAQSSHPIPDHPAITKLKKRREETVASFKSAAESLDKGSNQDRELAKNIRKHIDNFPPVKSWTQSMQDKVLSKQREKKSDLEK